nr:class I SAM-dependent methyltransferase [Chloroflexota bacterium]
MTADPADLSARLGAALDARADLFDPGHETAFRLFNGFSEGRPDLVADLYGGTLLLHNYAPHPAEAAPALEAARRFLQGRLPWAHTVIVKTRNAAAAAERRGTVVHGGPPDDRVREGGAPQGDDMWYAVDLLLNRDAGLYLDTRLLRQWLQQNLRGQSALNVFAYTGSLGVAARAGGARRVLQLDRNRAFLAIGQRSYALNGLPMGRGEFRAADFWPEVSRLKRAGELFDCVIVDPPFFSATRGGTVDLNTQSHRLINKVRPLVAHNGCLVAVNNALFVSGGEYIRMLEGVCADGYLSIETIIPVPPDFTGYPHTRVGAWPVDPAPFNHPTKIAILRARRKDERPATP